MIRARLAVAALLGAGLAASWWLVNQVFMTPLAAAESELITLQEERTQVLLRLRSARQDLTHFQQELATADPSARLFATDSSAATAWIQGLARDGVAAQDGALLSSQTTVSPFTAGYDKLSLLLRARVSETGLLDLLQHVEEASPPLIFETLEVQPIATPDESQSLDITAVIVMFSTNAAAP